MLLLCSEHMSGQLHGRSSSMVASSLYLPWQVATWGACVRQLACSGWCKQAQPASTLSTGAAAALRLVCVLLRVRGSTAAPWVAHLFICSQAFIRQLGLPTCLPSPERPGLCLYHSPGLQTLSFLTEVAPWVMWRSPPPGHVLHPLMHLRPAPCSSPSPCSPTSPHPSRSGCHQLLH
jgi:hypothetical protein